MNAAPAFDTPPPQRLLAGILSRMGGMACMALLAAGVKWCGDRQIPLFEMILFRSIFSFLPLGVHIARHGGWASLRTTRPIGHLARSVIGMGSMVCVFGALEHLPLTTATAMQYSSPLFMTALSVLLLGEVVGRRRWIAVAVGFVGVLIMVRPDPGHMTLAGGLYGLGAAVGGAAVGVTIRQIASERSGTIVFYFTAAGLLVGLVGSLFHWVTPDPLTLAVMAGGGIVGGVGQILITQAVRLAPVGIIAPFDYSQLLWAALLGFAVWREVPRPWTLVGGAMVVCSGLYILHREITLRRTALAASAVAPISS